MASQKIEELTLDLAELNAISEKLERPRNIDAVLLQKKRIETEISNLRAQVDTFSKATQIRVANNEVKRYECEISNYAWDQSDKFVKFFIGLDGVQNSSEESVVVTFSCNSILLKVANIQNKDYKFEVNNLLYEIDVEKSYRKIKTNSIAIYAKKATEGKNWSHLTTTEKRLADIKKHSLEDDLETNKDDPGAGLMKIMQKMYETGDSETKKMIAKAWTEGQQKSLNPDLQF
ncbi:calcyclin-binding protein [Sitodiplosis mosellana]|uniref:calcyclin-binding protein n=1 Tax=Sitodiplosis mosellana TaxID=263140 RepID=UPI0024439003|nr:calcyclin-binding protein [Sitodiplosis mosellana]